MRTHPHSPLHHATSANRPVQDLDQHVATVTHSWSNCPYNPATPSTYPCMWTAPQRLGTPYPTNAYENAVGQAHPYRATTAAAFNSWQRSSAHRSVLLN
ncbi:hypothetical protein [Parathermosynechococcus lividus]